MAIVVRRAVFLAASLVFLAFLFGGVLGFKKESDCEEYKLNDQFGELALCYNEVAVTYASMGDGATAQSFCIMIQGLPTVYAEGQANLCFADIARILKDDSKCSLITQNQYQHVVAGAEVTKKICEQEARKQTKDPMCSTVLVVLSPLALFIILRAAHKL